MAPLPVTFIDLEGHFAVWNLCVYPQRWFTSTTVRWRSNTRCQQHWWPSTLVDHSYRPCSWHQQDWLYGSLLMTRTALHACCAIVVSSATMCVQKYAGGKTKSDRCWKCSSGWHAICLRYSYNSRPIFLLTQSVARVSQLLVNFAVSGYLQEVVPTSSQ